MTTLQPGDKVALTVPGFRRTKQARCYVFQAPEDKSLHILQECSVMDGTVKPVLPVSLKHGDTVTVQGKHYQVVVNGDYSNAGYLRPVKEAP